MYRDLYGLPVSCASQEALDAYLVGVNAAMTLDHSGIAELERALELDPEFALAHSLLARQCLVHGHVDRIAPQLELAERFADRCQPWEQSSLTAICASLRHDAAALDMALAHAREHPRDVMLLLHIIGPFGLLAFSGRRDWREQNVALIEEIISQYPEDDWWMQATCGFSYAETGDLHKAIECAERSWQLSENGNSGHAISHAQIELAAIEDGLSFLDEWDAKLAESSDMQHHMSWHRALLMLESGATGEMLEFFASRLAVAGDSTPPLDMYADNASLLWRLYLRQIDVPSDLWESVIEFGATRFPQPGFVFADVHSAIASSAGSDAERQAFQASLSSPVVASLARACCEFRDGNYGQATSEMEQCIDGALLVGGSNPQRKVIQETYDEAKRRSHQVA